MNPNYAGSEVLRMAVEIEQKGKSFYDAVYSAVKDQKTKSFFHFLTNEEIRHEKIFRGMLEKMEIARQESPYDEREIALYFRSLVDQKIFPLREEGKSMQGQLADPEVAVQIAIFLERDSILFYHEMLPIIQEKDHPVIQQIIEEERDHIRRILQLRHKPK